MEDLSTTQPKRRGRRDRKAARQADPVRFLPEMDRGIPFLDLMTPEQVEAIHDASMSILETKGIEFRCDVAAGMWRAAGAQVDGHRVRIDRAQLMELIATAPTTYSMRARNPARTVTLGGRKQIFTPAYGAPNVLDLEGRRRNATMADFHNFAKLAHMSPAMQMSGGVLCEPMDLPVPKRHLHMVRSLVVHSDKPFMGMVTAKDRAEDTMAMADIVFGAEVARNECVMTSIANCNSPLVWDQTMLDAVRTYAAANQAVLFTPFVLGGASTPASTVGSVVQINAEALAGIAFAQLVRPGAPAVYGQWLATVSMKSGAPMSGTPEICHMNLMVGQMARFYKLPWRCSAGCSSSKVTDAQAGMEAARNLYGAMLAGANFMLSTTGYLEGALTQSYTKFVLDAEQCEMMMKLGQGPDFAELTGALDAMSEVEPGGHFLGTQHTLANFQTAFMMPGLMNFDSFEQWEADGAQDATQRAANRVREMLGAYEAPEIDQAMLDELDDFIARRERDLPDMVA
ncbi:MAG: trimethylamine methyltransferase family protein [Pseudomonadota bacterium]